MINVCVLGSTGTIGVNTLDVIARQPDRYRVSALTANTLLTLLGRCPRHSFIWLMGADNMAFFGSWQRHHIIARRMAIAVIDRPGYSYPAMNMGARLLDRRVTVGRMAAKLRGSGSVGRHWCFIAGRRHHASATALRQTSQQGANVERDD